MDNTKLENSVQRSINGIGAVAASTCLVYYIWFGWHLGLPISESPATWGAFGDFVGGLLNPLVAFAAFFWVTQSIKLQKQELEDTRHALVESQKAQQEQARLALLGTRTQSLNIRMAAVSEILAHLRSSHQRIIARAEEIGRDNSVIADDGSFIRAHRAIKDLHELIRKSEMAQDEILAELNKIDEQVSR